MSYDLDAFRLPAGMTVEEFYESGAREEVADDETPPTPEERDAMERLAAALAAVDPGAERFDGEDVIELTTDSLQVSVYAREAGISIPYWFDGAEGDAVMQRALEYARVLRDVGGYTVYDPQTEEVVGESGPGGHAYASGREATKRVAREVGAGEEKAPRWKFWKR